MADTTLPTTASLESLLSLLRDMLAAPTELTSREAFASMLDIGVSTFDRLREIGAIGPRPFRLGGALRWHRPEVVAWLSHRDQTGELYTAETWQAVWAALNPKRQK